MCKRRQHKFRWKRSCVTNYLDFYERVSSTLETNDKWVDCVFLDWQKTFDTEPHNKLLKTFELQADMINEHRKWLNYLTGREQRTHIRDIHELNESTSGIPQGFLFGPLLFLNNVSNYYHILFPDDAKLMTEVKSRVSHDNWNQELAILQDLDRLQQ